VDVRGGDEWTGTEAGSGGLCLRILQVFVVVPRTEIRVT
jgi:hypothetical protein